MIVRHGTGLKRTIKSFVIRNWGLILGEKDIPAPIEPVDGVLM